MRILNLFGAAALAVTMMVGIPTMAQAAPKHGMMMHHSKMMHHGKMMHHHKRMMMHHRMMHKGMMKKM